MRKLVRGFSFYLDPFSLEHDHRDGIQHEWIFSMMVSITVQVSLPRPPQRPDGSRKCSQGKGVHLHNGNLPPLISIQAPVTNQL